ncbi:MAG: MerR family transcriptional regulator [Microlunatus sp.]|nr:MerR family transcriptional regulator [Microlunatus sp.]
MSTSSLLTISAFARSVGLTPSALRFYDDAGLLAPATVDDRTGYRYYADSQRRRAVLVRQMRELDVPLTTMRAVLEATPERAEELLRAHADRLTERADRAWNAVDEIVRALRGVAEPERSKPTRLSLGGPEVAAAIRQVAPFAAAGDDGAALDSVLLDVGDGELTVVATDRYRMAARTLQVSDQAGPQRRIPIAVDHLTGLSDWLRRRRRVELSAVGETMIISDRDPDGEPGQDHRELDITPDHFPDYRHLVDGLAELPGGMRLIIDRIRLLELISADQTTAVVIEPAAASDSVLIRRLHDPEARRLPAVCSGDLHRIGFNPGLLASALQSSVGPDVLIDAATDHAAVIRSADQGSFTTLVMPVRLSDG